jgi:membrane protein
MTRRGRAHHAGDGSSRERAKRQRAGEDPADLTPASRTFVVKNAFRGLLADECVDIAAALTYYAVLSLFPAVLALVSLFGVFGREQQTTSLLMGMVRDLGAGSAIGAIEPVVEQLTRSESAGLALAAGLAGALWSASGYVSAFGRAMNQVYDVPEGRPFWKLRPMMVALTAVFVVLAAATALGLVVSGPIASAVGGVLGLSDVAVMIWGIAKWPVILVIVVGMVAMLYHFTPNVRRSRFRWLSLGALVALSVWLLASIALGIYVANFGSYNKTYGSLGGVIVFLLWLWITNLALLFGAELDAEIGRADQPQAGTSAEERGRIQLPPRETTKIDNAAGTTNRKVVEARQDAGRLGPSRRT